MSIRYTDPVAKSGTPSTLEGADDRTGKIRVADSLPDPDSDDGIPIYRVRARNREESGAIAKTLLDKANDVSLRRLGRGVPDELRAIMADALTDGVENIVSSIREEFSRSKNLKDGVPIQEQSTGFGLQRWAFVISIVTTIVLIMSLIIGSLAIMRMTDRFLEANAAHRADMDKLSVKISDAETEQLKLATEFEVERSAADEIHANHERRISQSEARQDALVIYLLEGVNRLLKDRRIPPPDIPPILQIAKAEIMLKYGGEREQK